MRLIFIFIAVHFGTLAIASTSQSEEFDKRAYREIASSVNIAPEVVADQLKFRKEVEHIVGVGVSKEEAQKRLEGMVVRKHEHIHLEWRCDRNPMGFSIVYVEDHHGLSINITVSFDSEGRVSGVGLGESSF